MIQRYGIDTLCGGCGQRGGGWSLVTCDNGPVVPAGEAEKALADANEQIAKLRQENEAIRKTIHFDKPYGDIAGRLYRVLDEVDGLRKTANGQSDCIHELKRRLCLMELRTKAAEAIASIAQKENERLRAAIATPEVYAGIVSDVVEKDFAEQIAKLRQENKRLTQIAMTTIDTYRFESSPCYICGYNGSGYYQPDKHPCAKIYHKAIWAKIKE